MVVRALAGRANRGATGVLPPVTRVRGYVTPPPVGGWNARDSYAAMDEKDAIILENWFPEETQVRVRKGHAEHATGIGSDVESLMAWTGPTSAKLFAAAGNAIYNVTAEGTVGAADLTMLGNSRFQHTMFGTSAGNFLYAVNGATDPIYHDGTTWTVPSLSGSSFTAADMIHVNVFKQRLFFVEKDSLNFWYLPVSSIAGTCTRFPLGPFCRLGGYLVAMGTWTRDGGAGIDDLAVFLTSKGECLIYQGTDPGNSSAWSLVGVFVIGAPLGRRCMIKVGGDLIVMTDDGFSQLSRFLAGARTSDRAAMSDKIHSAVEAAVTHGRDRFGWQPFFYPAGDMIGFNIPRNTGDTHQYVSHSTTGAWCKFTSLNGLCWEVHDNKLYFGGDGAVYQADTGYDDNGAEITATAKTAFSYFGDRGRAKRFAMVRPNFEVDGVITVAMKVNVDFATGLPDTSPSFTPGTGAEWDVAEWDAEYWADATVVTRDWQAVEGIGHTAAVTLRTVSSNGSIAWNAIDWLAEPVASGGYL